MKAEAPRSSRKNYREFVAKYRERRLDDEVDGKGGKKLIAPDAARDEVLDGVPVHRFRYLRPERAQTVCYRGGAHVNLRQDRTNLLKLPALVGAEWATVANRLRSGRDDPVVSWSAQ